MIASVDSLPIVAVVAIMVLMIFSGVVVLIGALGILRLPSFYQRMHGPAVISTVGSGALLFASVLLFLVAKGPALPHEILVPIFIAMTAPISAMLITRTAVYRDLRAGREDVNTGIGEDHPMPREDGPQEGGR